MAINILCVDDDAATLSTLKEWIEIFIPGAKVYTAPNCSIALHWAKERNYGLITVDGLDGKCFDLIERLKNEGQGYIAVLSANPRIINEAKRKGLLAYKKPEGLSQLLNDYSNSISLQILEDYSSLISQTAQGSQK